MNIGQRMRDRRIELNINPKDIADKIGKSVSTYYRYETGDIEKLTIDKLCEIADFLRISPVYLLLGEEAETEKNTVKSPTVYNSSDFYVPKYKVSESVAAYPSEEYSTQKTKELLSSLNMSLEEFSDITGISIKDLEKYKQGNNYVENTHIIAIAKALNISPVDILFKRDDSKLLAKIARLNAAEIMEVERYIDTMTENKAKNRKSTY